MSFKYDVAISFAGEDRVFAESIAEGLRDNDVKVFYDNFYAEDLWGSDLSVKLREIYHGSSQFCIMIISNHYIDKMWPSHERQQAIDRMIKEKGNAYILPVRLDGFNGEVPGFASSIGYLSVTSNEPQKIIDTFLRKIGKESASNIKPKINKKPIKPHIPKFKKAFSDKEKNQFIKSSFNEIVRLVDIYATDTSKQYPFFEHDKENVTSRKTIFTFYKNGDQIVQCKILIGGMFGTDSMSFSYGQYIDIDNDNSHNEAISVEEHDGELRLKPMGMPIHSYGQTQAVSPEEIAKYLWELICKSIQ